MLLYVKICRIKNKSTKQIGSLKMLKAWFPNTPMALNSTSFLLLILCVILFDSRLTCAFALSNDDASQRSSANLGDNVILKCAFDFPNNQLQSQYVIHWLKKGHNLPIYMFYDGYPSHVGEGYEGRVSLLSKTEASLNLSNVRDTDQGWYECKVVFLHPNDQDDKNGTWVLLEVNSSPYFKENPPKTMFANANDSVTEHSRADGTPTSTVVLQKSPVNETVPYPPTNVTISTSAFWATLMWQPNFDGGLPQYFNIKYGEDGSSYWKTIRVQPANSNTFSIYNLQPDSEYNFQVFATNQLGRSEGSNIVRAKTSKIKAEINESKAPYTPPTNATTTSSSTSESDQPRNMSIEKKGHCKIWAFVLGFVIFLWGRLSVCMMTLTYFL